MSIKEIRTQIDKFLISDTPEVIAIKGAWGVGKTYSWNKFLNDAKESNKISLDKYSYVSLFGINSLEAFKNAIFENLVSKKMIGVEASIDTFSENALSLIGKVGRKPIIDIFRGTPILKGVTPTIESIAFLYLNKTLICIDDLEHIVIHISVRQMALWLQLIDF